jgi:hypothetical protein
LFVACTGSESETIEDSESTSGDFVDRGVDHEDYGGMDGQDGLVTYSPFTAEETTELREHFRWELTGEE